MNRYLRLVLLMIPTVLIMTGCASDPLRTADEPAPATASAAVQAGAGETFRLRPGEVATIANGQLLVAFREVRQDSRCPVDVTCVWAGDAEAVIGVTTEGGTWAWTSLHSSLEPRSARGHGYEIALVQVEPAPDSDTTIRPEQYTVVLRAVN